MTFVLFLRLIIFFLSNWGIKGTNEQHCSVPNPPPPSLSQFSPAPSRQFHFVQYTLKILFYLVKLHVVTMVASDT